MSRGSQCNVCCADTIFFDTEHKCHRSWGSRDSFTLTYSILSPLISYSSRLYPTIGYLTTEKKLKSSDTPHCKAFNPVQGLLRVFFGGTEFISQRTSQHHDSCPGPVNHSDNFLAQRKAACHCNSMYITHTCMNKTSFGLEVSSPDLNSRAIGLASGCQLYSLRW